MKESHNTQNKICLSVNAMTRQEEFIKLYQQGYSYQQIGAKYGISRQRVDQIIKRDPEKKYRNKYQDIQNKAIREWLISRRIDKGDLPSRVWQNIKANKLTTYTINWIIKYTGMTEKEIREND